MCNKREGKDGCRGGGGHLQTKIYAIFVLKGQIEKLKTHGILS